MNEEMHICKHCGAETHQSDDVCYANPNLSSKKLSAVDWLINEFRKLRYNDNYHLGMGDVRITLGMLDEIEYQAKAMEKEQIEKAYINSNKLEAYDGTETIGEKYYNESYGGDK